MCSITCPFATALRVTKEIRSCVAPRRKKIDLLHPRMTRATRTRADKMRIALPESAAAKIITKAMPTRDVVLSARSQRTVQGTRPVCETVVWIPVQESAVTMLCARWWTTYRCAPASGVMKVTRSSTAVWNPSWRILLLRPAPHRHAVPTVSVATLTVMRFALAWKVISEHHPSAVPSVWCPASAPPYKPVSTRSA